MPDFDPGFGDEPPHAQMQAGMDAIREFWKKTGIGASQGEVPVMPDLTGYDHMETMPYPGMEAWEEQQRWSQAALDIPVDQGVA
jgi:hypothetical protein